MSDLKDFEIWCDKPSDQELVMALRKISPFLANVEAVHVLPNKRLELLRTVSEIQHVTSLVEYDRPDLMIFYQKKPILVVEITEHGYTGDNPLQRFARAVRSAELGVPFVHFTPFARTRLDELLVSDKPTSARRVSSRLFEGFLKLSQIYQVPVVGADWPVNEQGTPLKADLSNENQARVVFGELVELIECICLRHPHDIIAGRDIRADQCIQRHIEINRRLASTSNVLRSEIRLADVDYSNVVKMIEQPAHLLDLLGSDYFLKGKDHKLIAYQAIRKSRIKHIQSVEGKMIKSPRQSEMIWDMLPAEFASKPWVVLYNGYEWRGEPNGGIAANTEILLCRSENGRTIRDKDRFLAVVWPRVFLNGESTLRTKLLADLRATVHGDTTANLYQLISGKWAAQGKPASKGIYLAYKPQSLGVWQDGNTVTRIYRAFCDLVILNDAVLLGNHWRKDVDK